MDHLRRIDHLVEFISIDIAEVQAGLFEGQVVLEGVMRRMAGLVIADLRR